MRTVSRKIIIFLLSIIIGAIVLFPGNVYAESGSSFWIDYIDVGQGDSALIQCDGHYMLIDGGPSDASSVVYTVLKNADIHNMDYMIATHPDADHIGGLSGALNYATVGKCYSPVTSHDTKTFNNLLKYLSKQNITLTVPRAGEAFKLGSALVQIVGPIYSSSDTNNNSIVVKITYGSKSFLFMGDAENEEESTILYARNDLTCDVLKVGHHGSSSSTSSALLKKVNPDYAVISVGKNNSYGHPTKETLNKLTQADITIYRTDLNGDIICTSDGRNISFITEKNVKLDDINTSGTNPPAYSKNIANTSPVVVIPSGTTYVLNTNTRKFHYPSCSSAGDIKPSNRRDVSASRDEIMAQGYIPCKRCNP